MAKSNSLLSLKGTLHGITFVDSVAYGKHVRSARGTYIKSDVNSAFKAESRKLTSANLPAKIMKDAIDAYRMDFKGGSLWQRLVSLFRKQLKEQGVFDFSKITSLEINERYPMDRFVHVMAETHVDKHQTFLEVTLPFNEHPGFKKSSFIDGYRLGVIAVFPDLVKKNARTCVANSRIISLNDKPLPLTFKLAIPARSKTFVLCLKLEGCYKGEINNTSATKGMRIIKAGHIKNRARTSK